MSRAALHAGDFHCRGDRGHRTTRPRATMSARPTIIQINLSPTLGGADGPGTPLYGVGEIDRRHRQDAPHRGPLCEWDEHKLRDRIVAIGDRARGTVSVGRPYARRPGLTLGIVSRLAPLKQFPAMFRILAPII